MKKLVTLISLFSILTISFFMILAANATEHGHDFHTQKIYDDCVLALLSATKDLVSKEFPKTAFIPYLETYDEAVYDNPECMANIALRIKLPAGKMMYTIFHIHYSLEGKWVIKKSEIDGENIHPIWKPTNNKTDWKYEWCDFIRYYRPDELSSQNCL